MNEQEEAAEFSCGLNKKKQQSLWVLGGLLENKTVMRIHEDKQ